MFKLILKDSEGGEAQFPVSGALIIGRGGECDVILNDPKVSRLHARVSADETSLVIDDLGSINGTFVNGKKIDKQYTLHPGDLITVGVNKFRVLETNPLMGFDASTKIASNLLPKDDPGIRKKGIEQGKDRPRKGRVSVPVKTGGARWLWVCLGGAVMAVLLFLLLKG